MKYTLSFIIPVYNEEKNLELLHERLTSLLEGTTFVCYEIIFVDDGSKDTSWEMIQQLATLDTQVKGLSLTRNFGHQAALWAAYEYAQGDAVISLDADLQDPPEIILEMIQKWQAGAKIVYARRLNRKDSFFKKKIAGIYYWFLDCVSTIKIPRNVGDFRLIDKKVVELMRQCDDKSPYLRGLVAWGGFSYDFVDFNRPNRIHGQTGYTWSKMIKLGFDGLTSFSLFPLKIAAFFGFFMIITGTLMFGYVTYDALLNTIYYPLFKWLVIIIYIFIGVQMLLLWLIGEYIGRIHAQQQNRPLYVIGTSINCSKELDEKTSFPSSSHISPSIPLSHH